MPIDKNKSKPSPDFLVRWRSRTNQSTENIYWDPPSKKTVDNTDSELRDAVATLRTDSAYIEVSEVFWQEPTTITFTPNRIGFSLLVASSSAIEYGYDDETVKLAGLGNILFMLPGREIMAHMTSGRMRTVTCSYDWEYAESIIGPPDQLSQSQLHNALDLRSALISAILLRLMREAISPGEISYAVAESFAHAMLVECAHWLLIAKAQPNAAKRLTAREFEIVDDYLAEFSGKAPSVSELAAVCGFSERYFAKLFREQTGGAVSDYIKAAKIARAKAYLLETELPLKEIAYRLGYSTPANFSYSFREATGTTPGQFRKNR